MNRFVLPSGVMPFILALVLGLLTIILANDGFHYWHDIRFSYVADSFSMQDALSGRFNPEQRGGTINEQSAGGFYFSKILHVWLLQVLFSIVPPHNGGFIIAVWGSIGIVAAASILGFAVFWNIFEDRRLAGLAWASMLLMPVTPYLAGKLIAEVPALPLSIASVWLIRLAFQRFASNWTLYAIAAGVFLLLTGLARLDSILTCIGFGLTSILLAKDHCLKLHMWKVFIITLGVFCFGYFTFLLWWTKGPDALVEYFYGFLTIGMKSSVMSLLGILTFGGIVYIFAIGLIFAVRPLVAFLVLWFLIACIPMIVITWNYMVEPRYLLNGILPLMGIGALGLDVMWSKIKRLKARSLYLSSGFILVMSLNYCILHVMPYELDRNSITQALHEIMEQDEDATILIPWAYTDFHFLRMMYPEITIYNVNGFEEQGHESESHSKDWSARLQSWYGDRYVTDSRQVMARISKGTVFYLGWRYYPPIEFISQIDHALGLSWFPRIKKRLNLLNHLTESWVWTDLSFDLSFEGKIGQYEYYLVKMAEGANPTLE